MKFVPPLSDPEIHTLTDMQRFHSSRRARLRAHGLLLSHQGFAICRIAAVSRVARYAVSAWIDRWQNAGVVGLDDQPRSGRPPRLTPEEQHQVEPYLQEPLKELKHVVPLLEQDTHKRRIRVPKPLFSPPCRRRFAPAPRSATACRAPVRRCWAPGAGAAPNHLVADQAA
jgi:Homeodomain-like domain